MRLVNEDFCELLQKSSFYRLQVKLLCYIVTKDIAPASYDESGVLTLSIYDFLLNSNALTLPAVFTLSEKCTIFEKLFCCISRASAQMGGGSAHYSMTL